MNSINPVWYSEEVEITLTPEQAQHLSNNEVVLVLNAGFRSEQSGYNDEKKMIISEEKILFRQVDADQKE